MSRDLPKTLSDPNLNNVRLTRAEIAKRAVLQGVKPIELLDKPLEFPIHRRKTSLQLDLSPISNLERSVLHAESTVSSLESLSNTENISKSNTTDSNSDSDTKVSTPDLSVTQISPVLIDVSLKSDTAPVTVQDLTQPNHSNSPSSTDSFTP